MCGPGACFFGQQVFNYLLTGISTYTCVKRGSVADLTPLTSDPADY